MVTQYAVFGPGWGRDYLQPNMSIGSGDIAYRGHSLPTAKRVLKQCRKEIRQMRELPHMRNASDTYRIFE